MLIGFDLDGSHQTKLLYRFDRFNDIQMDIIDFLSLSLLSGVVALRIIDSAFELNKRGIRIGPLVAATIAP